MLVLGWSHEQWAYAKQRHKLHGNPEPAAGMSGLLTVREWWNSHPWPEPLSVRLEGVVLESDNDWAARAVYAALVV
jgi:hypothetical protein